MALGKYTRVDNNRRSSSYCSTVAIVVFVALCLIGVWMMTSSSSVSTVDMSSPDTMSESKERIPQINSKPFEDSSGDVPDDAKRGEDNDADANSSTNVNVVEKNQDENSDDASKSGTFNDANGKVEGGDATTDGGQSDNEDKKMDQNSDETPSDEQNKNNEVKNDEQSQSNDENRSEQDEKPDGEKSQNENDQVQQGKGGQEQDSEAGQSSDDSKSENQGKDQGSNEVFPDGAQSELLNETTTQNGAWATQAAESRNEKEVQSSLSNGQFSWKLCNITAGADYIPCLDNEKAIKKLPSTKHYEHRERHCPEEGPTCLVPLPEGYQKPIEWPTSRDKVLLLCLLVCNEAVVILIKLDTTCVADMVLQCPPHQACSYKGSPKLGKSFWRVSHFSWWWNSVQTWCTSLR